MVDIQGKGYITYPEFEFVMECTQRMVNYVDEYVFSGGVGSFIHSITKSGPGSVELNKTTMQVIHSLLLSYPIEALQRHG